MNCISTFLEGNLNCIPLFLAVGPQPLKVTHQKLDQEKQLSILETFISQLNITNQVTSCHQHVNLVILYS